MFRAVCVAIGVFLACGLGGCVQGAIDSPGSVSSTGLPSLSLEDAVYRLGSGDRLSVTVFGETNLSGEFVVNPEGNIAFPLVGEVEAGGMSVNEFSRHLEARLRDGYVREPRASVAVLNYRPYYILGEVGSPGTYPYSANLTVLNAVATAGGFTYRSDTRRIYIKHGDVPNEIEYALTTTTPVQPGDTIRILERRF